MAGAEPGAGRGEDGPARVKSPLGAGHGYGGCVEVAFLPGGDVAVRNSRDPGGPALRFTPGEWDAFIGGVQRGEFDDFGRAE